MEDTILSSRLRDTLSKGQLKSARKEGNIPAIVYGKGILSTSLFVDEKKFHKLIHGSSGENRLIKLQIEYQEPFTAMIKEIFRHPTEDTILHIDFHKLSMEQKIEITVPIQIVGKAAGVEAGGMLEHILWDLRISCLPTNIPTNIPVDVTVLKLGEAIQVNQIRPPEGVTILNEPDQIIVHVITPKVEEVAPAVPGAEVAAEPEVIGKGKKEEEVKEGEEPAGTAKPEKTAPATGKKTE